MRVLLDINVILDAMLIFYVGRKVVGTAAARAAIRNYLVAFAILPIDKQTLLDADALPGNDFEDNILIAAAATASLDAIVTRNVTDFSHSPIPVWDPAGLLKRLPSGNPPPIAGAGPATGPP